MDLIRNVLEGRSTSERVLVQLETVLLPNLERLSFFDAELDEDGGLLPAEPAREYFEDWEDEDHGLDGILKDWEECLVIRLCNTSRT